MPVTTYKGLSVQTATSNAGTWGAGASHALNEGVIEPIDLMLGAVLSKALTNVNVTLSATEIQYAMVRLTGTLTGAVQITSANVGFYMVESGCTGAFAVTLTNGVAGVTIENSHRYLLFADATNGVRIISNVGLTGLAAQFPSGTVSIFLQAAAPTGWTISASFNDRDVRLNSTGGGGTAGSVAYTTLFARTAVDNYTLLTADVPAHTHSFSATSGTVSADHTHAVSGTTGTESNDHTHSVGNQGSTVTLFTGGTTAATPGGGTTGGISANHTHSFSGTTGGVSANHTHSVSGTSGSPGGGGAHTHAIDMRVTYATAIPCSKD